MAVVIAAATSFFPMFTVQKFGRSLGGDATSGLRTGGLRATVVTVGRAPAAALASAARRRNSSEPSRTQP